MRFPTHLLAASIAMAMPVFGQTTASFGIQGLLATPGGDMTKAVGSDTAFGLGLQVRINFRGGNAIVPRIDRLTFSGDANNYGGVQERAEQTLTSLGVDYNWFPSRKSGEGFYFGGGLGFLQKEDKYSLPNGYYYTYGNPSSTKSRLFGSLMLGGLVGRHVDLSARLQFFGDERQADTYNASTGNYEARYSTSTVFTLGVAYQF